jgi:hypothetical protein
MPVGVSTVLGQLPAFCWYQQLGRQEDREGRESAAPDSVERIAVVERPVQPRWMTRAPPPSSDFLPLSSSWREAAENHLDRPGLDDHGTRRCFTRGTETVAPLENPSTQ